MDRRVIRLRSSRTRTRTRTSTLPHRRADSRRFAQKCSEARFIYVCSCGVRRTSCKTRTSCVPLRPPLAALRCALRFESHSHFQEVVSVQTRRLAVVLRLLRVLFPELSLWLGPTLLHAYYTLPVRVRPPNTRSKVRRLTCLTQPSSRPAGNSVCRELHGSTRKLVGLRSAF